MESDTDRRSILRFRGIGKLNPVTLFRSEIQCSTHEDSPCFRVSTCPSTLPEKMKKRFSVSIKIIVLLVVCTGLLSVFSYRKALRVETDALIPCLSPSMKYSRSIRLGAFNPFVAILPHWTITYAETPTNNDYATPSITVHLFGQVDSASKEVAMALFEKGYRDSY